MAVTGVVKAWFNDESALLWGGGLAGRAQCTAIFIASGVASFVAYVFLKLRG